MFASRSNGAIIFCSSYGKSGTIMPSTPASMQCSINFLFRMQVLDLNMSCTNGICTSCLTLLMLEKCLLMLHHYLALAFPLLNRWAVATGSENGYQFQRYLLLLHLENEFFLLIFQGHHLRPLHTE